MERPFVSVSSTPPLGRVFPFALGAFVGCLLVPLATPSFAQSFSRITTGDFVNDLSYSEGTAWADINGDGHLDLVVTNIVDQDNLLFLGDGTGGFSPVADIVSSDAGFSYGPNLVDFTGDGEADLFVANGGSSARVNSLYTGNGDGSFVKETVGPVVTDVLATWSAAAGDYDGDGDLDLFVANFNQNNALYENDGSGSFTRITGGDIVNNGGPSLGSTWCDYDADGDIDLFVANANFGAGADNFLYENDGDGTFTRVTTGSIVTDGGNSVGGSFADYDNDGDFDLFVTNYFGEDNFLYENNGGSFTRVLGLDPVTDGGSSVCASWADYDNDGDIDLFVANDLNEDNSLYENLGDATFSTVLVGDIVSDAGRSNSSSWADVDHDGDLDLYVTNGETSPAQSNYYYRNDQDAANAWIQVELAGVISNAEAVGAKVRLRATIGGETFWQVREVRAQDGYNTQHSLAAEFGLGDASVVEELIVEWPSGLVTGVSSLAVRQSLEITEPGPADVPGSARLSTELRLQTSPNPFRERSTVRYRVPQSGRVRLSLVDVRGREVRSLVDGFQPAGDHVVETSSGNLAAGVYTYVLVARDQRKRVRTVLIR